ncbi:ABC transporter ATP-binding protein [Priestia taiwanensis]|uniref:Quaternary amine transport ATP-binding protein n=1 Tax=Priestia taiwanensis TaxID=1347902 RepID=A0A917ETX3_9BACI|nr:ABC transporter ATP-binding protein [Priestia taiwanensis]MBM7364969.1 osmoprotectant transport system ATP-binding protein [Priestia taiwanensis]GGE82122.1 glycine/betaine ABC transporter ATP-binding protein [Priestia taiwanensis]
MITFEHVSKVYPDGTKAVNDLNLHIEKGEFFVFIGPSGCGKTTTMKMMNRLNEVTSGTILINGKEIHDYNIHELRRNIGYVLQQIALFPHMTVEENIAVVPELKKWSKEKIHKRVTELLEMVELDPQVYRHKKPNELSGGQQQRIGVIRALAADPDIVLMDEPFSALDPITREQLQNEMKELQQKIKKTIIFVTHDMNEALLLGDRVCLMRKGEIVQCDTPQMIVQQPANDFVREFLSTHTNTYNIEEMIDTDFKPFSSEAEVNVTREKFFVLDAQGVVRGITENGEIRSTEAVLSMDTNIEEVMKKLTEVGMLAVEKEGRVIGVITNESVVRYLHRSMQEKVVSSNG